MESATEVYSIAQAAAGQFEVVTDEHGQQLVKLVIVDQANRETGCAYVTPEEASQILAGVATLQTIVDDTAEAAANVASDTPDNPVDVQTLTKVIENTESLSNAVAAASATDGSLEETEWDRTTHATSVSALSDAASSAFEATAPVSDDGERKAQ